MKNKSVFKYLVLAIIFLLAVISISVYKKNKQTIETKSEFPTIISNSVSITPSIVPSPVSDPLTSTPIYNKKLEAAVFSAVEAGIKSQGRSFWDKEVEITKMDTSLKAATGKWWASDAWDWIAWQQNDNSWKVLVSFDGFNCQELETVPSQYNDFFKNQIYPNFGGDQPNKKYCY